MKIDITLESMKNEDLIEIATNCLNIVNLRKEMNQVIGAQNPVQIEQPVKKKSHTINPIPQVDASIEEVPKKKGRPKGSPNKPKEPIVEETNHEN